MDQKSGSGAAGNGTSSYADSLTCAGPEERERRCRQRDFKLRRLPHMDQKSGSGAAGNGTSSYADSLTWTSGSKWRWRRRQGRSTRTPSRAGDDVSGAERGEAERGEFDFPLPSRPLLQLWREEEQPAQAPGMSHANGPHLIVLPNPARVPRPSPHDRLLPPLAIARLHLVPPLLFPNGPLLPLSPYSPFSLSPPLPLFLSPPPPPPFPPHPPPSHGAVRAVPRNGEALGAAEQGAPRALGAHARAAATSAATTCHVACSAPRVRVLCHIGADGAEEAGGGASVLMGRFVPWVREEYLWRTLLPAWEGRGGASSGEGEGDARSLRGLFQGHEYREEYQELMQAASSGKIPSLLTSSHAPLPSTLHHISSAPRYIPCQSPFAFPHHLFPSYSSAAYRHPTAPLSTTPSLQSLCIFFSHLSLVRSLPKLVHAVPGAFSQGLGVWGGGA
ncbi:unnamed protein product [Closterium sp. Naga37s-1]|nr:unnamed protein product [Closterium sp. Naga37s-1]